MLFEFVDFANSRLAAALEVFPLPTGIFWLYSSGLILLVVRSSPNLKRLHVVWVAGTPVTHGLATLGAAA